MIQKLATLHITLSYKDSTSEVEARQYKVNGEECWIMDCLGDHITSEAHMVSTLQDVWKWVEDFMERWEKEQHHG